MDLKEMLLVTGMMGLFIFSFMAFVITAQTDAGISIKITDNDIINETYGDLQSNLNANDARQASSNFGKTTPTSQFGELELTSIVSPTSIAKELTIGIWNIFIKLPVAILGVDPSIAAFISGIFLILIIIAIWAVWKGVIS